MIAPVHVGEPIKIRGGFDLRNTGSIRVRKVSLGNGQAPLQSHFWVHAGPSIPGASQGDLSPSEQAASRPAAGTDVRNGDMLFMTLAFRATGTYRITSVRLHVGDGLRQRIEVVPVDWCFIAVQPSQPFTSVDHAPCETE